jgi:hypothetical protein
MQSTYVQFGVPESLAVSFTLVWLSLSLAPWLGGLEIGPVKVPRLGEAAVRILRVAAPIGLILFIVGFLPTWQTKQAVSSAKTFLDYSDRFWDEGEKMPLKGELFLLNEPEANSFRNQFGATVWDGGTHWGKITFDDSGRIASFRNNPGRSPGRLLIQGVPLGSTPIILAEWKQENGDQGFAVLGLFPDRDGSISVSWGPGLKAESHWKREH